MTKIYKSYLLLVFFILSLLGSAYAVKAPFSIDSMFVLPSSLERIENSAFEGTAVKTLVFSEGLQRVGDAVFENARYLTDIFFPSTIKQIGISAFPQNIAMKIHGAYGSYAEKWAREFNVTFYGYNLAELIVESGKTMKTKEIRFAQLTELPSPEKTPRANLQPSYREKSMKPQDRPELNPIDYRFP